MSYEHLRKRLESNEGGEEDEVELQNLVGEEGGKGIEAESTDDAEADTVFPTGSEDRKSLISEEIDENGVVREYEVVLKYVGFGLFHILLIIVNGIALSSDAVEVLSISFILPIIRCKDELGVTDWQNALLSSIIFLGMLFGGYFWGGLSDLSGRRCTLLLSLTLNGVFGLCSAFAPNFATFLIFRFISGIGVGGSLPVIFSYMSEFIRNKYRGPYLGIQSTFWMVGTLLCGALAWLIIPQREFITTHSWRVFIAMSAIPSLLGALLYLLLPESPRFLLEVGREREAMRALRLAYRLNHFRDKNAKFPIKSIQLDLSGSSSLRRTLDQDQCCSNLLFKFAEVFRRTRELYHRKLLRRTLLLMVVLFCLSFGSYGVALWFPSYVQEINIEQDRKDFERFCGQQVSDCVSDDELRGFDGCSDTVFENAMLNRSSLNDWRIYSATFRNVTFIEANFSKVVFEDCEFINCTMESVRFNLTYFVNSKWNGVRFDNVAMQFSDICVLESQGITVVDEILLWNSTVNRISPDTAEVNQTLFLQLLNSTNFTCVRVPEEEECEQTNENRVYRDNFFISASALPGNIASAIAVYFLRRNYWLAFSMLSTTLSVFLLYVNRSEVYVVIMLCLFRMVSTPAWNDSSLIIAEVYPTHLRSTAMGVHLLMARIGAIMGTNIFGEFVYVNPAIPIFLMASVLFVGGIAAIPLPKTTRKTLLT